MIHTFLTEQFVVVEQRAAVQVCLHISLLPQLFGLCLLNTNSKPVHMRAHCFDWEKGLTAALFDVGPGPDLNQIPGPSILSGRAKLNI